MRKSSKPLELYSTFFLQEFKCQPERCRMCCIATGIRQCVLRDKHVTATSPKSQCAETESRQKATVQHCRAVCSNVDFEAQASKAV